MPAGTFDAIVSRFGLIYFPDQQKAIVGMKRGLPPLPGQPGPFSLGDAGVLEEALQKAGFRDVQSRSVPAPGADETAADCVRFEKESFGARTGCLQVSTK